MTNHVHLIFRSTKEQKPEQLLGGVDELLSKAIVKAIKGNPQENRREVY